LRRDASISSLVASRAGIARQPLLAGLQEFLGPAIIEILMIPSFRHSSAMLS